MTSRYDDRPWLAQYSDGVASDVSAASEPLTAALERNASVFPQRTALDFMGKTMTYGELSDQVLLAAGALAELGVTKGDRVAIALPNCITHVVAFYAVLRLGAVVVEHNPTYSAGELEYQLQDSDASVAICWEQTAERVAKIQHRTQVTTLISVDITADTACAEIADR